MTWAAIDFASANVGLSEMSRYAASGSMPRYRKYAAAFLPTAIRSTSTPAACISRR